MIEDIQTKLLRIRMVKFGTLETRLGRAINVTCLDENKKAALEIENGEVEIDTQVIDSLIEPLLHLLKNAVVHGIEPPDTRRLIRKPERGTIRINIEADDEAVVLSVSDDGAGIAGILGIDGLTYFVSAWCLYKLRSVYLSPREHLTKYPREFSTTTEATAEALETGEIPEVAEAGLSLAVYSELKEGFAYLRQQPTVRALGVTHSILMAGVVSANVLLVALAANILHSGPRGLGYLEGGWGLGAIVGGLLASQLPQRLRMTLYAWSIAGLALGHLAMPFITFLLAAVFFQVLFGFFRALSGVVAQAALMLIVPRHFMGRTQSAIAVLTTVLQVLMSFALGWISQQLSIFAGFAFLALIYAFGTLSAFHARRLLREQSS